jgi:dihydrofolate synthase/folylpolyglutamate synthase
VNTVKPITNFAEAGVYLQQFHERAEVSYTLDRMRRLMAYLGNPQNRLKVVHVAGTSGKTSTAYFISALLTAAGRKTGLTVSPHVDEMNERIQLNGQPLPEREFCAALADFALAIKNAPVRPSRFELTAAMAFWYFAREGVDYAVVEVGLGGLLDATNVINRPDKVCVVTDIGLDHMAILGNTLPEIATQKFGVVQEGNPVFMHRQEAAVMQVAKEMAATRRSELHVIDEPPQAAPDMPAYQWRNWTLAKEVYEYIATRDGLRTLSNYELAGTQHVQVPGRMDVRQYKGKTIVMDGAHNAQKMTAFTESFKKLYPGVRPAVVVGIRTGKEYTAIVPMLAAISDTVICTTFETTQDLPIRSMDPEALAEAFRSAGASSVQVMPDQSDAIGAAVSLPENVVVITGSIYMLGQIRQTALT